jgi:hypothetical protein
MSCICCSYDNVTNLGEVGHVSKFCTKEKKNVSDAEKQNVKEPILGRCLNFDGNEQKTATGAK